MRHYLKVTDSAEQNRNYRVYPQDVQLTAETDCFIAVIYL